jgi:hypothetical protein
MLPSRPGRILSSLPKGLRDGLVGAIALDYAYGGAGDLPASTVDHPPLLSGTVKRAAGKSGLGLGFGSSFGGGTTGVASFGQVPTIGYGPSGKKVRSLFFRAFLNGYGGGTFGRFMDRENRSSPEASRNELFYTTTGGVLAYSFYDGYTASTISLPVSSSALPLGEITVGLSVDLSTDTFVSYVNGKRNLQSSTGSTTRIMYAPVTGSMVTGNRPTDLARTFDGIIYGGLIYDRFLTDAMHEKLHATAFLQRRPRRFVFDTVATVQFLRPISDISNSGWTPSTGASLAACIGEAVRDDATYISATAPGAICEVLLGASSGDPLSSINHLPRIVMSAGSGGIILRLKQGATVIKAWTYASLPLTDTLHEPTLTSGEIDSISDYTDLRLEMETTT